MRDVTVGDVTVGNVTINGSGSFTIGNTSRQRTSEPRQGVKHRPQAHLLFAFGHPEGMGGQGRLDLELATIAEQFRTQPQAPFLVEHRPAVTAEGLRNALIEIRPQLLHLSAHGDAVGLTLQARLHDGGQVITYPQLAELVQLQPSPPKVVVLNACNSVHGASALLEAGVRCVIAMDSQLTDHATRSLARGLYSAIARQEGVYAAVSGARYLLRQEDLLEIADSVRDVWAGSPDRDLRLI